MGFLVLRYIPSVVLVEQFGFDKISQQYHCPVILVYSRLDLCRENRNAVVDTIVKGKVMTFEFEVPVNCVKVIFFIGKTDAETISEKIGDLVEPFQPAVVCYHSFSAS
jgi:hypothetical protein